MKLRIRDAKPEDMAFVITTWRQSFEGASAVRGADREHYREEMTLAIRRLCDRATVRVACDPTDEDTLAGFAAFRPLTDDRAELHYIYVKLNFRGHGIARDLLDGVRVVSYTFRTTPARPPAGWAYTPRFTIS